jgi:AcrR family transcriptional regulator
MPQSTNSPAAGADSKRRRADAQHNYELLLTAAKDVFSEQGVDAPLDDIARRAGVGNATMYRHFPTRRDLIIVVYADEVTELCAQVESMLEEEAPDNALFDWMRLFIAHVATKRQLALAISDDHGGERSALFDGWHEAMRVAMSRLLNRAQQTGAVRADLDAPDLLALASGIALAGGDTDQIERLLRIIRRGTATNPR